jgi:hypothetical protein
MSSAAAAFGLAPIIRLAAGLTFRPLEAADLFELEPQPSQATWLGNPTNALTLEEAAGLADCTNAWAARVDGQVLACFGVAEMFAGRQGIGWSLLGVGLGRHHLPLTRFVRDVVIGESPLARIETFAPCAEAPHTTGSQIELVSYALQHPTPEVRWAMAVGFLPLCVLRKFGAASETFMLFERIR